MSLNKFLIVTNNLKLRENLESLITKTPLLSIINSVSTLDQAITSVKNQLPDAILIDMKTLSYAQSDLLCNLRYPQLPIIGFSDDNFDAVNAYTLGLLDFMITPVKLDRFTNAVNRIYKYQMSLHGLTEKDYVYLKMGRIYKKMLVNELSFIEAYGIYTKAVTSKGKFTINENITKIEEKLKPFSFVRIHKSYIINSNRVESFSINSFELSSGIKIPIGPRYRQKLEGLLSLLNKSVDNELVDSKENVKVLKREKISG